MVGWRDRLARGVGVVAGIAGGALVLLGVL
jgi:hypothetical protein